MEVDPDVVGRVVVLEVGGNAMLHGVAIAVFELRADGRGEELPLRPSIEVGGCDAADSAGLGVGVGDTPFAVEAHERRRGSG